MPCYAGNAFHDSIFHPFWQDQQLGFDRGDILYHYDTIEQMFFYRY
jgi:hypothetical protein